MTNTELTISQKETKYRVTVKGIRARNFSKNLPFLILSDQLPDGQVYREFKDGHIELQEVFSVGAHFRYRVIKTLTTSEADIIRKAHGLF
jgi:hypothetical protein